MSAPVPQHLPRGGAKKRPRKYTNNPLRQAIHTFLSDYTRDHDVRHNDRTSSIDIDNLVTSIPKHYTVYRPLLLLPTNFFSCSPSWLAFLDNLSSQVTENLYQTIAKTFRPHGITHIAVNSPISLITSDGASNVTRSPTKPVLLYGEFGPRALLNDHVDSSTDLQPSPLDFEAAFWVSTTQNDGIVQIWAPLWTMFSRGNIREKARILGQGSGHFSGLDGSDGLLGQDLGSVSIVDMYVGIGYFAFSYLMRGIGRVWGWDINGWSVEGLKRGCRQNGWALRILKVDDKGLVEDEQGRRNGIALRELASEIGRSKDVRMVAFWGDNRWASQVLGRIKRIFDQDKAVREIPWLNIRHVNLGLLPSSESTWKNALNMLDVDRGGWIHIHENARVQEIEMKRNSVVEQLRAYGGGSKEVRCTNIEQVKSYAPGVTHCVFDAHVQPRSFPLPMGEER